MSRIKSLFNIIKLKIIYNLGKKKKYDIKVIPASKCVDEILSKKVSVVRFGDGEFDIIRGKSIGYQKYDKTLANRMLDMILRGSNDKIMICLPDVFQNMDRYNDYCDYFYNSQFFVQKANSIINPNRN
ncbi:GT-D fold domain-containing glycosyltransferase [Leuconostoc citreum]|uniref:GT-D fold domain-containing glycosyltransferase n=1 Tax=Leuconostoc citreum TaxID=33964 RepID=UPI00140D9B9C|nr:GT-D fold domain-containing glycosyltransferase [Leuconostoc citreum]